MKRCPPAGGTIALTLALASLGATIAVPPAAGQTREVPSVSRRPLPPPAPKEATPKSPAELPRFSLEFFGGSPRDLIDAIDRVNPKSLNAIIPEDVANTPLPPFRVRDVTVEELFATLTQASQRVVQVPVSEMHGRPGRTAFQNFHVSYGFRPSELADRIDANTIWVFYAENPPAPTPTQVERYVTVHQIHLHLKVYEVADVATAITLALGMMKNAPPAEIEFHEDTGLLLVSAGQEQLVLVKDILAELEESAIMRMQEEETARQLEEAAAAQEKARAKPGN